MDFTCTDRKVIVLNISDQIANIFIYKRISIIDDNDKLFDSSGNSNI